MHTIIEADAAAVRASVALVERVTPADLGRPTPCAEWDLRALLAHMTAQHRGFAAAAAGAGADLSMWQPQPSDDYADAAEAVLAVFAAPGVLDRPFVLPEVRAGGSFPGRIAVGFHLVDYVVHAWDVAQSLGIEAALPAFAVEAALPIARAVPDGASRVGPGAAFAPGLAMPAEADAMAEILLRLGRTPVSVGGS